MAIEKREKIRAIADASFLIGLSLIRQWRLIEGMVEQIYVAPAVWEEVFVLGQGKPGTKEMSQARFIKRYPVKNKRAAEMLEVFLGPGEAETLALAQEMGISIVFLDDLKARKAAQKSGLRTMGVAGFLLAAKQKGLVQEIRPLLEELLKNGFRLSQTLMETVLKRAGENSLAL
jgi:predicted nucleic acid-binding protein